MKNRIIAPAVFAAFIAGAVPVMVNGADRIVVDKAPPVVTAENVPPARAGYVWAPGYWNWNGSKYEWVAGHWMTERQGYRYVAPRWAQEEGRWTLYPENWVKNEDDKEKTVAKDSSLPTIR
jgi:hypothetical protein